MNFAPEYKMKEGSAARSTCRNNHIEKDVTFKKCPQAFGPILKSHGAALLLDLDGFSEEHLGGRSAGFNESWSKHCVQILIGSGCLQHHIPPVQNLDGEPQRNVETQSWSEGERPACSFHSLKICWHECVSVPTGGDRDFFFLSCKLERRRNRDPFVFLCVSIGQLQLVVNVF